MPKLVPIVEGSGETRAVQVLLHKLLAEMNRHDIQVAIPKNARGRSNLIKAGGLEKFIEMAWRERECGAIVILLDAEDDCPVEIAKDFSKRVAAIGMIYPVVIVCAKRMYEAWFLASLETIAGKDLAGRAGLIESSLPTSDIESIKSPKSWLNDRFPKGRAYKETEDQETMTRLLDPMLARERSRSFRRLCHALEQALEAIDAGTKLVTPTFTDKINQSGTPNRALTGKRGKRRQ